MAAEEWLRTRIVGHLSLAEVYANEFLSDVTDGAVVKHATISVIFLQIGPQHCSMANDAITCGLEMSEDGLTGFGIVLHFRLDNWSCQCEQCRL